MEVDQSPPLLSDNLAFLEEQYARFVQDPASVDETWRAFFGQLLGSEVPTPPVQPHFTPRGLFAAGGHHQSNGEAEALRHSRQLKQAQVSDLIQAYRRYGHLYADLDPLERRERPADPIRLEAYGLSARDLGETFSFFGRVAPLAELIDQARETYARSIGVELSHIDEDAELRSWLEKRIEANRNHLALTPEEQVLLLTKLSDAEIFEQFLHTKFVGAKRFSLEGAESLIPMLELVLRYAAQDGTEEVVIGMAHRGRLNVLANILSKPARDIFAEFRDKPAPEKWGRGDVKYHMGYAADRVIDGRSVHVSLNFNPSHLEFVDPVVVGRVRAKQDRRGDRQRNRILSLLVHGDAALAGQGIVAELFNMAQLPGYAVGGTIHVVVNNQIGFTTDPRLGRSSLYPTDLAKVLQIPIFHVNGEDPEAVAQVVRLAVDVRLRFQKDVVIDLWCYRRYGHNEGDDPGFTNPLMVQAIAQQPSVRESFARRLIELGHLTRERADEIAKRRRQLLEEDLAQVSHAVDWMPWQPHSRTGELWTPYRGGPDRDVPEVDTSVPAEHLGELGRRLVEVPAGFEAHKKLLRLLEQRREMAEGKAPIDWGMAEALAFATLVAGGVRVRVTGQDTGRGTFSHRHAVWTDQKTGQTHVPLAHLELGQGPFEIVDSPLSEASCVGFEFGYSRDMPDGLVIWEAQFGDFANGAQVIIDQFIASSEDKWHRLSGLVMLLPHGLEGQGPEHSSARLERWLAMSASDNMQICNLTTAAQYFHLLRRQVLRPYRKPLIVMTPKSMLRLADAASPMADLAAGRFQRVLTDARFAPGGSGDVAAVRGALLCSGKVYYDLVAERRRRNEPAVPIIRLEQIHPTPWESLREILDQLPHLERLVFVQEEPRNQGAWRFLQATAPEQAALPVPFEGVTRPAGASPATGSAAAHALEQQRLVEDAFAALS